MIEKEGPRRRYTRDEVRKRVEAMSPEQQEAARRIGQQMSENVDKYVPVPRESALADHFRANPSQPVEIPWEEGEGPMDLAKNSARSSAKTADLLERMIASNAATARSNHRTTWINLVLATISCAAAVYAAVVATP